MSSRHVIKSRPHSSSETAWATSATKSAVSSCPPFMPKLAHPSKLFVCSSHYFGCITHKFRSQSRMGCRHIIKPRHGFLTGAIRATYAIDPICYLCFPFMSSLASPRKFFARPSSHFCRQRLVHHLCRQMRMSLSQWTARVLLRLHTHSFSFGNPVALCTKTLAIMISTAAFYQARLFARFAPVFISAG